MVMFLVLRLDGDMFESCLDILTNLYDKLTIGGFVLIDDWQGFPCQSAVQVHTCFVSRT